MESNARADALTRDIETLREQLCKQALLMANLNAKLATEESKGFYSCQICSENIKRPLSLVGHQPRKKHLTIDEQGDSRCFPSQRKLKSTRVEERDFDSLQSNTNRKRKVTLDSSDNNHMVISS